MRRGEGLSWRAGAVWMALLASACFVDTPTTIDRICPSGNSTCKCMPGGDCAQGLTCEDDICRNPRCVDGQMGCACASGFTCEDGLECVEASCLLPGNGSMSGPEPTSTGDSGNNSTVTSTSAGPGNEVGSLSETESESESEAESTITDSAESGMESVGESTTGPVPPCQCGWDEGFLYFGCGPETLPFDPDPKDEYPFDCPDGLDDVFADWLSSGDSIACDAVTPALDHVGCCLGGATAYCGGTEILFEVCDDTHFMCAPPMP